jgi:L-gulonate 3-dehydrogenase
MNITIVGVGFIGRAFAIAFARAGHSVTLWARRREAEGEAMAHITAILPALAEQDLLNGRSVDGVLALLGFEANLAKALAGADYVQENAAEDLVQKRALFERLDQLAPPNAILASSTSALLPSLFTDHLEGRARCLVVHPINPPFLVPAVEIVPAPWTLPGVIERARLLMLDIGQAPIVMKREIDGFVMNRLQGAVLQEAFRLVAEGYASPADVDIGIRDGLALRWAFMGPFETIDLNAPGGVSDYVTRYESLYAKLFETQQHRVPWGGSTLDSIEKSRREKLSVDNLDQRRLWRDRRLAMMVAHKRAALAKTGP